MYTMRDEIAWLVKKLYKNRKDRYLKTWEVKEYKKDIYKNVQSKTQKDR